MVLIGLHQCPIFLSFQFFQKKINPVPISKMAKKAHFFRYKSQNKCKWKQIKFSSFWFFFYCHMISGSKVMIIWWEQLISCSNAICQIDNSHRCNLGSTGQFRIFENYVKKSIKQCFFVLKNIIFNFFCSGSFKNSGVS